MLSLVTAAEQQYRHESMWRDRELALLASIRARHEALAVAARPALPHAEPIAHARAARRAWPRPIGVRLTAGDACSSAACAVA